MTYKNTIWVSLSKYNVAALLASTVDFLTFLILSKGVGIWYVSAAITGAILGSISAFLLNRNWVFNSTEQQAVTQFAKYVLIWTGSVLLNTGGLFLMVESTHLDETISKIIVSVIVGIGFNFFASKYFVFKKKSNEQ